MRDSVMFKLEGKLVISLKQSVFSVSKQGESDKLQMDQLWKRKKGKHKKRWEEDLRKIEAKNLA